MSGPLPAVPRGKRGKRSLVAEHHDRAAIEVGLANGVGLKTLSARYGIAVSALSRYRQKMPPELIARLRVRPMRSDEELSRIREIEGRSVLDNMVYIRGRCYANADLAVELGDPAGERAALAEAGKTTERIAKLLGEMGTVIRHDHKHVHIAALPEWHVIRTELVEALRPYPEAWKAAVEALARAESELPEPRALIEGEVVQMDAKRGTELV